MPGGGADIRQIQFAAQMKNWGKQWRPSKVELHKTRLAELHKMEAIKKNKIINRVRFELQDFLYKNYSLLPEKIIKTIIKMIRCIERYIHQLLASGPIFSIKAFPVGSLSSCSSLGKPSRGPPDGMLFSNTLSSITPNIIVPSLNTFQNVLPFTSFRDVANKWYVKYVALPVAAFSLVNALESGLENKVKDTPAAQYVSGSAYAQDKLPEDKYLGENWKDVVYNGQKCFVMFYFPGNPDQIHADNLWDIVKNKYDKKIDNFYKINVMELSKSMQKYVISIELEKNKFPSFIFYNKGVKEYRIKGPPHMESTETNKVIENIGLLNK